MDIIKHTGSFVNSGYWTKLPGVGIVSVSGDEETLVFSKSNTDVAYIGAYSKDLSYNNFKWIQLEFDLICDAINLSFYTIGILGQPSDILLAEQIGTIIVTEADTTKSYKGVILAHDSPDLGENINNFCFGILEVGASALTSTLSNLVVTELDLPPTDLGVGETFESGLWTNMGTPDTSVTHANHTVTWDAATQRLKVVATGAGLSYYTWAYAKDGRNTGYVTMSDSDSSSAVVAISDSSGAFPWTIEQEGNGTFVVNNYTLSNNDPEAGIGLQTTEACTFYVDRFAFVGINPLIEV